MIKLMVFIDGTWLYSNLRHLAKDSNQSGFYIDYGVLPHVLKRELMQRGQLDSLDIVRTFLFGSYPVNFDTIDDDRAKRRRDFFSMLREDYHYEVEAFPVDYQRRRILYDDRMDDDFSPKEKCVDIALATSMMYYASIPGSYDIALAVVGDKDYFPLFQKIRCLGKRVAVASIRQSCAKMYADRQDEKKLKDYQIIWLNDIVDQIALKSQEYSVECKSPLHEGPREVKTTVRLREGQSFFCDECRAKFAVQRKEQLLEYTGSGIEQKGNCAENWGDTAEHVEGKFEGTIENLKPDRGFGFIKKGNGLSYFFHMTNLANVEWSKLQAGQKVRFTITKEPDGAQAGAAGEVVLAEDNDASAFDERKSDSVA